MNKIIDLVNSLSKTLPKIANELSESERFTIESALSEAHSLLGGEKELPSIPKGAEVLWLLSGENPRAFSAYMRNFPNPEFNAFARNSGAMNSLVQQLGSRITPPSGESQDGIAKSDLQSSNVYGFQYDPSNATLKVRFNNGGVYEYNGVPPFVYKMFARGAIPAKTDGQNQWGAWWQGKQPSLGASFYELIRDNFPYERVA